VTTRPGLAVPLFAFAAALVLIVLVEVMQGTPLSIDQRISLIGVGSQVLTSLAAISVAVIAYFASRRSYMIQSRSAMLSMINDFNALALTNDDCLRVFTKLLMGAEVTNLDESRKIWATYSFLNNRQLHYFLAINADTNAAYLEQDKKVLVSLLQHSFVLELLENGGYDPQFVAYCKEAYDASIRGAGGGH
jgi:hypothetical protein